MNLTDLPPIKSALNIQQCRCPLEDYSIVEISGDDNSKLLQGQLTCDIDKLDDNQASLGAFCNVQGRVHAIFYIFKRDNNYYLVTPKDVVQHLIAKLSIYSVFFKAQIIDVSQDYNLWGVYDTNNLSSDNKPYYPLETTAEYSRIYLPTYSAASLLISAKSHGTPDVIDSYPDSSEQIWDYLEVLARIPMVFNPTIEKLLPHFIGLDQVGGISFDKGCYTGQEIVARMHYRGKLKTHSQLLLTNDNLSVSPASKIYNAQNNEVGEVIRSARYDGKTIILASLADKALEQDLYFDTVENKLILITE